MKLWKIIAPLTICLVLMMLILPATASAASEGTCGENVTWTLDNEGTLTISGTGPMENYSRYQNKPWQLTKIKKVIIKSGVTSIGDYAFADFYNLESVTIPSSVTYIGVWAFYYTALKSVTIPNSVTTIKNGAFIACDMTSVTLPSKLKVIEEVAFASCPLKTVTIPNSVTTIENGAFNDCEQLTSVTIPNSVTTIEDEAFSGCASLKTVSIGSGVMTIGKDVFAGCEALTKFTVNSKNSNFSTDSKGALYNKDKTVLYQVPCQMSGKYAPDAAVTTIAPKAFMSCHALTQIQLGKNVAEIGSQAFYDCTAVTDYSVNPENPICFADDRGVLFCNGVLVVAPRSLSGEYRIPNGVGSIGTYAFYECRELVSVFFGKDVTYVGADSFTYCTALTTMSIPKNISFEYDNFYDCKSMKDVYYRGTEAEWDAMDPYKSPARRLIPYLRFMDAPPAGDMDDDWMLSTDDAVYLLLSVMFGTEDYPVPDGVNLDFDGSKAVDTDDAVYLLLYVMFGEEDYPLPA